MHARTSRTALTTMTCLTVIVACLLLSHGCVFLNSMYYPLAFTPDSKTFVYSKSDQADFWIIGPEATTISQSQSICWCPASQVKNVQCVDVDHVGREYAGYHLTARLKCSRDSKYLAVTTRGKLVCIELATADMWPLSQTEDIVTSFEWISNDEIGYVAHTNLRGEFSDRSVWRQHVRKPFGRQRAHQDRDIESSLTGGRRVLYEPIEHWSPHGNYVVFKTPRWGGPFALLNVRSGSTRPIGEPVWSTVDVAWKPDESAVVLVSYNPYRPNGQQLTAVVLDLTSGELDEFSGPFNSTFDHIPVMSFGWTLAPHLSDWTADGEYLIVNDIELGGCLVRPRPWSIKRVGQQLAESHPLAAPSDPNRTYFGLRPIRFLPDIAAHPRYGWVWAQGRNGIIYAGNYEEERFVPFGDVCRFPSPDGRLLANVTQSGVVSIRRVDLGRMSDTKSATDDDTP